jgi:hypothetical protein
VARPGAIVSLPRWVGSVSAALPARVGGFGDTPRAHLSRHSSPIPTLRDRRRRGFETVDVAALVVWSRDFGRDRYSNHISGALISTSSSEGKLSPMNVKQIAQWIGVCVSSASVLVAFSHTSAFGMNGGVTICWPRCRPASIVPTRKTQDCP